DDAIVDRDVNLLLVVDVARLFDHRPRIDQQRGRFVFHEGDLGRQGRDVDRRTRLTDGGETGRGRCARSATATTFRRRGGVPVDGLPESTCGDLGRIRAGGIRVQAGLAE